jgi:Transposase DDE domain
MLTPHSTLTASEVHDFAQRLLRQPVRLKNYSGTCTATVLYYVVLFAAATATTIAQTCRTLTRVPCDQTLYDALDATLPDRIELQRRINRALAASVPKAIRRGRRAAKIALDLTLIPYYGKSDPRDDMVYRGQEKAGTHNHHAYATAYLVCKGRRFTLAMIAVRHNTPWDEIVKTLLRLARRVVPAIGLVLVDRGFYSVAVVRYLQRARYPFIMPVIARGRKADDPRGVSGTRAFFRWRRSGWSRYTMQEHSGNERATVDIAVKIRRKLNRRTGSTRPPSRVLVYACWGVRGRSPHEVSEAYRTRRINWLRQTYRGRFGIETSYRQMNQGRAWTTSRKPVRRLLLVGLALLLRNIWALLHLTVLAQRRRGGPRLRLDLLPLLAMLDWIAEALKQLLGFREHIETQHLFIL